jgi:hypothetical protein
MKTDYRIDFKAQTAAHFTTYSLPEQSRKIVARNKGRLQSIAANAKETFSSQAIQKLRNSLIGANVNIIA